MKTLVKVCHVSHFQALQSEGPAVLDDSRPASDWPHMGAIRFSNVRMRYRSNLPLVLKGVTFEIRSREKIGMIRKLRTIYVG